MILFSDANGTIQANFGTPVYQGSANSNIIYLIAPYAPAASVTVAFQLPDGTAVAPVAMTPQNAIPGVQNESGTSFAGWSYTLPGAVTAKYGTVTAQFFFYAPTGQSANPTSIIATSATSFQIGRGAAAVLPDTPDADVYESILSNLAQLQTDLNGGYYGARAIFPWSNGATYGQNEITFYPSIGQYGAFVQSVVAGNTNNAPYVDGALNSAYWSEVVNFNTVTDDFFAEIKAVQIAAEAAQSAAESAQGKAEDAQAAAEEAESGAQTQAQAAASSATAAEESADAAERAKVAAQTAQNAAENAEGNAQAYAGQASSSAGDAAQSASAAAASANRAQEIVNGIGSVYKPVGSIAFSALPATPAAAQQGYVYNITDAFTTDARFVEGAGKEYPAGTNVAVVLNGSAYMYDALSGNVDLSNYAQTNGTYPNMTVGNASNAASAEKASQDAAGNDIEATYATKEALTEGLAGKQPTGNYALQNGTYSGMTVGQATNADNATKATQDASGNVITATYATKAENNAKYTKPSTGIPESDLASAVQTSLNKADTALQSVPLATSSKVGGVKPASKTSDMTQSVGVDSNGALWTKEASEGTTVVANPTATGTQDLTSLQVGGTVYNIPQGGGGITQSTVIERPESLPTATADSPDFVEVGGVLYRKKAVEGGSLLGTWVFDDVPSFTSLGTGNNVFNINFLSNGQSYTSLTAYGGSSAFDPNKSIKYNNNTVFSASSASWSLSAYKKIQITDISALTNVAEFTTWLTANATKQGGGATVSYEYVAQQDIPTPTTADNGKVLGVANGAYALQAASGGGSTKRYCHNIRIDLTNKSVYFSVTDYNSDSYSSLSDVVPLANTAYISGCITEKGKTPDFSSFVYQMIELDNKSDGGAVYAYYLDSTGTRKYVSGNSNDIASDLVFELGS